MGGCFCRSSEPAAGLLPPDLAVLFLSQRKNLRLWSVAANAAANKTYCRWRSLSGLSDVLSKLHVVPLGIISSLQLAA